MKFGVIIFPGSNCDHDAYHVISKHVGQPVAVRRPVVRPAGAGHEQAAVPAPEVVAGVEVQRHRHVRREPVERAHLEDAALQR